MEATYAAALSLSAFANDVGKFAAGVGSIVAPGQNTSVVLAVAFFALWTVFYNLLHPVCGVVSSTYRGFARDKDRIVFRNNITSSVHSFIVVPLSIATLLTHQTANEFSDSTPGMVLILCVSTGYFYWDVGVCIVNFHQFGLPFFAHGVACAIVYTGTLRPFAQIYGLGFLVYETSTIFLNFNWFFEKMGLSEGSSILSGNRMLLLLSFLLSRWVWGGYLTVTAIYHLWTEPDPEIVSTARAIVYTAGNVLLSSLNVKWGLQLMQKAFGGNSAKPSKAKSKKTA